MIFVNRTLSKEVMNLGRNHCRNFFVEDLSGELGLIEAMKTYLSCMFESCSYQSIWTVLEDNLQDSSSTGLVDSCIVDHWIADLGTSNLIDFDSLKIRHIYREKQKIVGLRNGLEACRVP